MGPSIGLADLLPPQPGGATLSLYKGQGYQPARRKVLLCNKMFAWR